ARDHRGGQIRPGTPVVPVSPVHRREAASTRNPRIYGHPRRSRGHFDPRGRTLYGRRYVPHRRLPRHAMARGFLLNPPSPEPVKTPLLAFCHLASSLRAGGHEVAILDASTPHAPRDIEPRIAAFAPDVVGMHLKTLHVQPAYALMRSLAERWPI